MYKQIINIYHIYSCDERLFKTHFSSQKQGSFIIQDVGSYD